jgi:hypothetical protein
MKTPIIVDDNGDINAFDTIDSAEKYLEPYDVDREDCAVYDGDGQRLRLRLESRPFHHRVRLTPSGEPPHAEALRERLTRFLVAIGESRESFASGSLSELIATLVRLQKPRNQ